MQTIAVVLKQPEQVELNRLALTAPTPDDLVVDVDWSGISTGTERLLWSGRMPPFPGMGYPLVPGYEVGRPGRRSGICQRPSRRPARLRSRREMFRRGARPVWRVGVAAGGAGETRGAARSSISASSGILLALAATAYHAIAARGASAPDCIVGHGVLGRLLARISIALRNEPPTVWEKNPARVERRDRLRRARSRARYAPRLQEHLRCQRRCQPAGFADRPHRARRRDRARRLLQRAAVLCVSTGLHARSASSRRRRMAAVRSGRDQGLIDSGRLSLDGLITHRTTRRAAPDAYRVAFEDPACLKMVLNWSSSS